MVFLSSERMDGLATELDRRSLLRLGAVGAGAAVSGGLLADIARGAPVTPAPSDEDFSFVQLGVVGELVSIEFYRAAASQDVLSKSERNRLTRMVTAKTKLWDRLNEVLGDDAVTDEDFAVDLPTGQLRKKFKLARLGERLERLMVGSYLSASRLTEDPGTRVLFAQMLAFDMQNFAWFRGLRGAPNDLRIPKPMSVEYVGTQIDRYLSTPGVAPA